MEQENLSLKGDVMRREREQPQISSIQDNCRRTMDSISPKAARDRPERYTNVPTHQEQPTKEGNPRRRREFARERAITKPYNAEREERGGT